MEPSTQDPGEEGEGIGSGALLVSLLPFALLPFLFVAVPSYGARAFVGPPHILGIPLGMVGIAIGVLWGALGVYLVSEADSVGRALAALVACSLPASLIVVTAPSVGL